MAPASVVAKNVADWLKWIWWPYSWRITSASSASSTPPLPKRIWSLGASVANELSTPHWLMRTACDRR